MGDELVSTKASLYKLAVQAGLRTLTAGPWGGAMGRCLDAVRRIATAWLAGVLATLGLTTAFVMLSQLVASGGDADHAGWLGVFFGFPVAVAAGGYLAGRMVGSRVHPLAWGVLNPAILICTILVAHQALQWGFASEYAQELIAPSVLAVAVSLGGALWGQRAASTSDGGTHHQEGGSAVERANSGFPRTLERSTLGLEHLAALVDGPIEELIAALGRNKDLCDEVLLQSYDKRYQPSPFISEAEEGFRVGWYHNGEQAVRTFARYELAVADYLLFSFGKGRLPE